MTRRDSAPLTNARFAPRPAVRETASPGARRIAVRSPCIAVVSLHDTETESAVSARTLPRLRLPQATMIAHPVMVPLRLSSAATSPHLRMMAAGASRSFASSE